MKTVWPALLLVVATLVSLSGCIRQETNLQDVKTQATYAFEEVATPAAPGSAEPNLYATPGGDVFLSWIEPGAEYAHALRFARLEGEAWSAARTIAEGDDWFVNWADFPSLLALDDGALAAHFLAKSGSSTYAYDVLITRSEDSGAAWSPAIRPHRDGTPTEHGFVSMVPWKENGLLAVWLDGRNTGGGSHDGHGAGGAMTLRAATLASDGTLTDEALLDARICDCCQTAAARTSHGVVVAYRDRSDEEIRDIAVVRLQADGWSAPQRVHADDWQIAGCPVNGPAVAALDTRVAVAWFTMAGDDPRVFVALSADEGATFGAPLRVDDGHPIGRVDTVVLPDGAVVVSWVEETEGAAALRVRRFSLEGTPGASVTVASTSPARASGFPHLALRGRTLYVAWTEPGTPSVLRTAAATL